MPKITAQKINNRHHPIIIMSVSYPNVFSAFKIVHKSIVSSAAKLGDKYCDDEKNIWSI